MPWYAWLFVAYIVIDRLTGIAMTGKVINITPAFNVVSCVTGALMIWMVFSLV